MQYLGGKKQIAKKLVAAMNLPKSFIFWEPFCGGMGMTEALVQAGGRGIASDIHPVLIAMWQALFSGWEPPEKLSEAEYRAAKALPDTNPLKGFAGFGCSFGGKWFGGYARGMERRRAVPHARDYVGSTARSVTKTRALLAGKVAVAQLDFFAIPITPGVDVLYCDPPYANTTGYSTGAFNHAAFWARCLEWSHAGSAVYVSEFSAPAGIECVASFEKRVSTGSGVNGELRKTEKLFSVPSVQCAADDK